jgi:hypothetical protein
MVPDQRCKCLAGDVRKSRQRQGHGTLVKLLAMCSILAGVVATASTLVHLRLQKTNPLLRKWRTLHTHL